VKKVFKGWACNNLKISDLKTLKSIDDHICPTMNCAKEAWEPYNGQNDFGLWPPKRVTVTVEVEDIK
jgi:hypothetical protein